MRHQKKGTTLDRKKAPRTALLRNLATSIILYEKVKTTEAKAKAVKPIVEKLVTIAKKNDLMARRRLLEVLFDKKAVEKALNVLGTRYQTRAGGYLRITKLSKRPGDGAAIVQIEFV